MRRVLLLILFSLFFAMTNAQNQAGPPTVISSPMKTYSFRLRPGQDLKQELDRVVLTNQIEAGTILTGVGSLTDVTLRLANQEGGTLYQGHFEIVSLVGTLSTNGSHIHLSVSDSTGRTLGGHLLAGCKIYTTAELVIGVFPELVYTREPDPTFNYRELVVRKKPKKKL